MAATDKKELSVYKDGAKRPYFVKAENVNLGTKEEPEFLTDKLAEMEEDIEEAKESQGGYTPPQGGIPATDLAPAVQTSLGKADTAYQKPESGIPANDLATGVIPDVSQLATKTEVNAKANAADVYTKSQADAAIQEAVKNIDGSVDISSQEDGTIVITMASGDVYTIDLNHNHPQYLKYVLLENEAAYNALTTKDSSTLYIISESNA